MKTTQTVHALACLLTLASVGTLAGCGAQGSESSSGEDTCKAYVDESSQVTLPIVLKNNRTTPIYVDNGGCERRFDITAEGATWKTANPSFNDYLCELELQCRYGPSSCMNWDAIEIAPGASLAMQWDGLVYEELEVNNDCYPQDCMSRNGSCLKAVSAPAGTMEATVTIYQMATGCQNGWCGGKSDFFKITKSFQYPEEYQVVFEID